MTNFQRDGHVMVRQALGGPVVRRGRAAARAEIEQALAAAPEATERRPVDYFTTIQPRDRSRALRDVVGAPEVARLAAEALGVARVRLLYDQIFAKPPGAVATVWHQDQVYLPIDVGDVIDEGGVGLVRSWVTLEPLPAQVGGLHFVDGSHRFGAIATSTLQIGAPGRVVTATIDGRELPITGYGAFGAGDATFHAGYALHGSAANTSDRTRYAVAVVYVPDGARVAEPTDDLQAQAAELHVPGRKPGDLIDTPSNPILWPADAA